MMHTQQNGVQCLSHTTIKNQMWLLNIGECMGFSVYRGFWLLWSAEGYGTIECSRGVGALIRCLALSPPCAVQGEGVFSASDSCRSAPLARAKLSQTLANAILFSSIPRHDPRPSTLQHQLFTINSSPSTLQLLVYLAFTCNGYGTGSLTPVAKTRTTVDTYCSNIENWGAIPCVILWKILEYRSPGTGCTSKRIAVIQSSPIRSSSTRKMSSPQRPLDKPWSRVSSAPPPSPLRCVPSFVSRKWG